MGLFRKKKKEEVAAPQTTQSMCDAIQQALKTEITDMAAKAEHDRLAQEKLKETFNQSSLREGLECLKKIPGSTFDYTVTGHTIETGLRNFLDVQTNIFQKIYTSRNDNPDHPYDPVCIHVRENGLCSTSFEDASHTTDIKKPQDVITLVARAAMKKGIIPAPQ